MDEEELIEELRSLLLKPTSQYTVTIEPIEMGIGSTDDGWVTVVFDKGFTVVPKVKLDQLRDAGWVVVAFGRNHDKYSNVTATFTKIE